MWCISPSSSAVPSTAARRAGAARSTGVASRVAAPALAAALAPNSHGSSSRASLQTGIAVFASRAPVYVASGGPLGEEGASAGLFRRRRLSPSPPAGGGVGAPPPTRRSPLPTPTGG